MINANWLLVIWGTITVLVIGMLISPMILPESDAILPIKGYVSEAKKNAEAIANATTTNTTTTTIEAIVESVIEVLDPKPKTESSRISQIIGISLSKTCYQMHKYNLTTACPTYKDLLQFDNTIKAVTGYFNMSDGVYQRQPSNYQKHCNFYQPNNFPLLIVVDPDGCWFKERGIKTITIQAINPQDMLFKLRADSAMQDKLRDLQRDERDYLTDKNDNRRTVDLLEINIENQERLIRNYEDQIEDLDADDPRFKKTNLNRQLKTANQRLADLEQDLREEEAELSSVTTRLSNIRTELQSVKLTSGSGLVINGTTHIGVGRYVKECKFVTVGADMQLITDTINYLISKCKDTTFDSRKTTYIEQTPINIMDHTWYKYQAWLKKTLQECKILKC